MFGGDRVSEGLSQLMCPLPKNAQAFIEHFLLFSNQLLLGGEARSDPALMFGMKVHAPCRSSNSHFPLLSLHLSLLSDLAPPEYYAAIYI